jgi:hypothetical protein
MTEAIIVTIAKNCPSILTILPRMLRENFPEFRRTEPRGEAISWREEDSGQRPLKGTLIILISFSILFLTLYVGTGFRLELEARKGNGGADDRTLGAAGRRES